MKRVTAVLLVLLTALAVFAACSKNSVHTVTFDSSGGTQIKTQHILDGESAKKPWDPHKEGFTFIEWQYNGAAFDFNTAITGDITLVASYSIDEGTDIVLLVLCYGDGRENEIIEIKRGERRLRRRLPSARDINSRAGSTVTPSSISQRP